MCHISKRGSCAERDWHPRGKSGLDGLMDELNVGGKCTLYEWRDQRTEPQRARHHPRKRINRIDKHHSVEASFPLVLLLAI